MIVFDTRRKKQGALEMRGRLLATVVACGGLSVPALAADLGAGYVPPSGDPIYRSTSILAGDIQLSLGFVDSDSDKSYLLDGLARANVDFGTWNLLAEFSGTTVFDGEGDNHAGVSLVGHLWAGDAVRYGVFGGAGFYGTNFGGVGVEAEADFANSTLGGQLFYLFASGSGYPDVWGLRGWWDYYFTPNTKVTGQLLWASPDGWGDVWSAGGRLSHRFAGMPFNIFGEVNYTSWEGGGDTLAALGGLSFLFDGGAPTQQDFDRSVPFDFHVPLQIADF